MLENENENEKYSIDAYYKAKETYKNIDVRLCLINDSIDIYDESIRHLVENVNFLQEDVFIQQHNLALQKTVLNEKPVWLFLFS